MFHNRMTNLGVRPDWVSQEDDHPLSSQSISAAAQTSLVMVPCATPQAPWQVQLYQMAYQTAVAQLAASRRRRRYAPNWN